MELLLGILTVIMLIGITVCIHQDDVEVKRINKIIKKQTEIHELIVGDEFITSYGDRVERFKVTKIEGKSYYCSIFLFSHKWSDYQLLLTKERLREDIAFKIIK